MWYGNSIVMIFGIAIIYLIAYCVRGIIWGWAVKKIVENKGYNENWFWWGFFFGILALLVALTKPDKPKTTGGGSTNFEKASDVADRDSVSKNFVNENKITDTSGSAVKNVAGYVMITALINVCFLLFPVIDGVYRDYYIVGMDTARYFRHMAEVKFIPPFVIIAVVLFTFINVAGSAKFEICLKNNDVEGANKVFRNGMILIGCISIILGVAGVVHGFMPVSIYFGLLGSREASTVSLYGTYILWYSLFIIPSGFLMGLLSYRRNNVTLGFAGTMLILALVFNVLGNWLLVSLFYIGMKGLAVATGVSQTIILLIVLMMCYIHRNKIQ